MTRLEATLSEARPRILALLLRQGGPIEDAEDALAEAVARAAELWPKSGMPESPTGWLLTTARRLHLDRRRREGRLQPLEDRDPQAPEAEDQADERLRLFMICADVRLSTDEQTGLMLQLIQGLTARQIADACLEREERTAQRLVRAKRKLRGGAVRDLGDAEVRAALPAILEAVYAAAARGWEQPGDREQDALAREALDLASTLAGLCPKEPEALGLAALLHLIEARRPARRDPDGGYIPLDHQDPAKWSRDLIVRGEDLLHRAGRLQAPGPRQWEAAIQSAHVSRVATGRPGWEVILSFYDELIAVRPSVGARIARCAALAKVEGPASALRELGEVEQGGRLQAFWALKAHLCHLLGLREEAQAAQARAAAQAIDPAVETFISRPLSE